MEAKYRPARVAGHAQRLKDKAMEVTIRLSCVLSDVIAHGPSRRPWCCALALRLLRV